MDAERHPIASVVVIAHNEETRLLALWSLADNRCRYPVEVIGVNNGSTDRTVSSFMQQGCPAFEERKSPGYARACGQEHARGKYCICIDGDTPIRLIISRP